ncbi:hypothetical protein OIU79_021706 [Salix purpurea]|uniref:Uncharacterized protein n=1 Tax=Salix purpurea TaxID=77065 RepID=A0A9Q1ABN0_SALPP|nr:hypothetical protein OIU79_021706 [Salix purpurea]
MRFLILKGLLIAGRYGHSLFRVESTPPNSLLWRGKVKKQAERTSCRTCNCLCVAFGVDRSHSIITCKCWDEKKRKGLNR